MQLPINIEPVKADWQLLTRRPQMETQSLRGAVSNILQKVKTEGDDALREFSARFDQILVDRLQVDQQSIELAGDLVEEDLKSAIGLAKKNIERFHAAQAQGPLEVETMPGIWCSRTSVAIEKVGLYVPGGSAPLFSTVLMLAVPATIAGCSEIVLCTPPQRDGRVHPAVLYAAKLCGVTKVFRIGGAQAIAAMAFGTGSVPAVNKIFGPGNQFVTCAKQLVSETGVAIDMPAGPSELAVYANATSNSEFVAADLLSQAEHGADSQVVLVASSHNVAQAINLELEKQLPALPRKDIARASLGNSRAVVLQNVEEAFDFLNAYAPEHLILAVDGARALAKKVKNAGSVFLGHFSAESIGDYASGTNHTLPTFGYAKAYSGVSVDSFVKKITFQEVTRDGLQNIGPAVETMALAEGLDAHAAAVTVRLNTTS